MNKQIEEMTNCLCDVLDFDYDDEIGVTKVDAKTTAEGLYNAGYRKASEVAKEIGDEIAKNLMQVTAIPNYVAIEVHTLISIINKYTEGER
jgi:hypothetical protein